LISALDALALKAVTEPATAMLSRVFVGLPSVMAAVVLLAVALGVGKFARELTTNVLTNVGFNSVFSWLGIKTQTGKRQPAQIVGQLALIAVVLIAMVEALQLVGLVVLVDLLTRLIMFLMNVLVGIVILGIGLFLGQVASKAIGDSGVHHAHTLALAARTAIIGLASAMALNQMGLATDIINVAFGLIVGSAAVAVALAFGLGGRSVAEELLLQWLKEYEKRE
jgi:hypothetical protein